MPAHSKKGFTLVELLVVISIIAILSAIGITVFSSIQETARDARRREDLRAIQSALEVYRNAVGSYPYPVTNDWVCSDNSADWIPGLSRYFASGKVPESPSKNVSTFYQGAFTDRLAYCYYTNVYYGGTQGSWYMLVVPLEKPTPADLATGCVGPNGEKFSYGSGYGKNTLMACNLQ